MIRIIMVSRAVHWAMLVAFSIAALSMVIGTRTITMELAGPPTKLLVSDLCAIVAATVAAILMRPRLWEWERVAATARARVVAGSTAALGIALPVLCALAIGPEVHGRAPWVFTVTNALVLAAVVQLIAPLIGPFWAGTCVLAGWYVSGFVQHVSPAMSQILPISAAPAAEPSPGWTVVLVVAAVTVHARTLGTLARRRAD